MELYISPPEGRAGSTLSRGRVLAAFAEAGLTIAPTEEQAATGRLRAFWIVPFEGTEARLEFQETDAGLVFATLDQSMFDNSGFPERICAVLEQLGWEVDQEVG
jgi:hypothetical protein